VLGAETARDEQDDPQAPNSFCERRRFIRRSAVLLIRRYESVEDRRETVWVHTGWDENHLWSVERETFVDSSAAIAWIDRYAAVLQRYGWRLESGTSSATSSDIPVLA
jgi:hypothetical protein